MSEYPVELERIAQKFGMSGDEMLEQIASGELVVNRAIDVDDGEDEALPQGISMDEMIALADEIDFPHEDLEEIASAIREAHQVDSRDW